MSTGDVGAGTSATIADLAADTAYRVQVRARGAGKGSWSSSGAGRTAVAGDTTPPEGKETFRFRLSNAQGAVIEDGEATGTITNSDPLQKMWLSRFGRTVADHVTGAVSDRLANPLAGAQVTVAGQTMNLAELEDDAFLGQTLTSIAQIVGAPSGPASPGSGPGQATNDPGSGPLGSGSGSRQLPFIEFQLVRLRLSNGRRWTMASAAGPATKWRPSRNAMPAALSTWSG